MRKADKLPTSCALVTKSGNLNFLEHSGPLQACNGTALPVFTASCVVLQLQKPSAPPQLVTVCNAKKANRILNTVRVISSSCSIWRYLLFVPCQHVPFSNRNKVKQFVHRHGQALSFIGDKVSQISWQVVSRRHRPPLPPQEIYSFLLETGSTSWPQCGWKDYVNELFQWRHRESNPRPSGL